MASVPTRFPNSTIVCIGGGPSLLPGDVDQCRGTARVIAINDAYRLAPWADVLYAADAKWWQWHPATATFAGLKYGIETRHDRTAFPSDVEVLRQVRDVAISTDPTALAVGRLGGQNSGYQAINLAVHLGASRILLLGYDMAESDTGQQHWFGDHPIKSRSPYGLMRQSFDVLPEAMQRLGIAVINCSRRTALTQFQRLPIERVLSREAAA